MLYRRYALVVIFLVALASLPTLAATIAGSASLDGTADREPAAPFIAGGPARPVDVPPPSRPPAPAAVPYGAPPAKLPARGKARSKPAAVKAAASDRVRSGPAAANRPTDRREQRTSKPPAQPPRAVEPPSHPPRVAPPAGARRWLHPFRPRPDCGRLRSCWRAAVRGEHCRRLDRDSASEVRAKVAAWVHGDPADTE